MMSIFSNLVEEVMEIFMDDFSVYGSSFEDCLKNLETVLQRCQDKNLALNWEKCHFMITEGICSDHKARPDPVGGSEPKARGRLTKAINQIPLVIILLNFSFQKCRDPNPQPDPNGGFEWSPVYSDVFIYLHKTFY